LVNTKTRVICHFLLEPNEPDISLWLAGTRPNGDTLFEEVPLALAASFKVTGGGGMPLPFTASLG